MQASSHDRETPLLAASCAAGALRKNGDLHRVRQKAGGTFGSVHSANDQHTAFAFVGDSGHRLGLGQAGCRQQSGHFGRRVRGLTAPAAGFADVDKTDRRNRAFGLLGQFTEETLFLGAGHHHGLASFHGFLKLPGLAATQGGVQRQLFTQGLAQGLGLQGHGLVAIANQGRHVQAVQVQAAPYRAAELKVEEAAATVPQLASFLTAQDFDQGLPLVASNQTEAIDLRLKFFARWARF